MIQSCRTQNAQRPPDGPAGVVLSGLQWTTILPDVKGYSPVSLVSGKSSDNPHSCIRVFFGLTGSGMTLSDTS